MDLSARRLCYMELTEGFKGEFAPIVAYLGGIELYDEQMPSYKVVPKETQRRMLIYLLNSCKDLIGWIIKMFCVNCRLWICLLPR